MWHKVEAAAAQITKRIWRNNSYGLVSEYDDTQLLLLLLSVPEPLVPVIAAFVLIKNIQPRHHDGVFYCPEKQTMTRIKPTRQIYANYSAEDFSVWKILFERQMANLRAAAAPEVLEAIDAIGFHANAIPDFGEINKRLAALTGWQIVTVTGICPPAEFFRLLAQKTFTCTCWLRTMAELDYLEEPDMFHDVFGHVPLLTNAAYSDFFQKLGALATAHIDRPEVVDMIERLYWFTIEFGLRRSGDAFSIYGAGILSSTGETAHALSAASRKHRFDPSEIMSHPFRTDVLQEDYYVVESFAELVDSLPEVEAIVNAVVAEAACA
jgi:phenylalanine-4-hydroxylase